MSDLPETAEHVRRTLRERGLDLDDVAEPIAPGVDSLRARIRAVADRLGVDDAPRPPRARARRS
ncbi:MAG TPA: hypothetical protein VFQ05_15865 [Candidatus Eisenbacteria bacterium]|nr:hypothetical protein [Candidatus Eisenbacteria bacterium]